MGQPGAPLVSHLGVSNYWYAPVQKLNRLSSSIQLYVNLTQTVPLFIKYGIVYIFHFFYPILEYYILTKRSLPHSISMEMFYTFYRFHVIKNSEGFLARILMRKALKHTYYSSLKLIKTPSWLFLFLTSQHLFDFLSFVENTATYNFKVKQTAQFVFFKNQLSIYLSLTSNI